MMTRNVPGLKLDITHYWSTSHCALWKQFLLIMPLVKTKVNSLEQTQMSQTSASKFIRFLCSVSFIAVNDQNGKLVFKIFSFKTLLNILVVFSLCLFRILCLLLFEHESDFLSIGTIVQMISKILVYMSLIIPVLQPMILRYSELYNMNDKFWFHQDQALLSRKCMSCMWLKASFQVNRLNFTRDHLS